MKFKVYTTMIIRHCFLLLFTALCSLAAAQTVKDDFRRDIHLSASNHLAYPGPTQTELTPAPEGKKPFYISHYGRHGSRYLINPRDYEVPYQALLKADSAGMLTELGKDVVGRLETIRAEAASRYGELSPLGAVQHRQIANRMFHRFPEVFEGEANIDAKSTVVIRCILSMENELLEFMRLNPKLKLRHDASMHDMYYMNLTDKNLTGTRNNDMTTEVYEKFRSENVRPDYMLCKLFSDTAYASRNIDVRDFHERMFKVASTIQNTEARYTVSLYDLFTDDDIYGCWRTANLRWYLSYGACPLNGGKQPYTQRNLLRRIIDEADSCIALPKPGATLRFGHETMVMPLTCLIGIDGYDLQTYDVDNLESKGWINYKVFPMGANIQFVFYRSSPEDKDVIFKVLLNENEARLPISTDMAPYYHWSDFRSHYLQLLDNYEE